ncbi:MAG: hypothetical protein KF773_32885 [Deltaproteobacteria bacterium]|nr:hypothetical protein [Deltaproteobacteria bacterium]
MARLGAVLVEERVLRRIIKGHRKIPGIGLQVPHEHCYTLPRADLERLVERDELAVDLAKLPARVVAIRGPRVQLEGGDADALSAAWRAIFHGRVHQVFDEKLQRREISAGVIRERVNRIGQTEFDEIRSVLKQEELLLPPVDEVGTYVEFVALYLELLYFSPLALERTFPALLDNDQVGATIRLDLDPDAILAASRPGRAPEKPIHDDAGEVDQFVAPRRAVVVDPSAREAASRARVKGNLSRAAILSARAGDDAQAMRDLDALVARLAKATSPRGADPSAFPDTKGWAAALLPVAKGAASQFVLRFSAGARLLHDLQTACIVAEREVKVVDAVAWAMSFGKAPVVRALPATREVRVAKHVRAAVQKASTVAVSSTDERSALERAVHAMTKCADDNVRVVLRPKFESALNEVGLSPHNLPERVAQKKLVDELLDHAVNVGRLSIGNLRDALSANDLKMTDLELRQLRHGDQLLEADKILSQTCDGVYRRGESYMRFLQKLSSLFFGTRVGRFLTLYAILPLLGGYVIMEGISHIVGPAVMRVQHTHLHGATVLRGLEETHYHPPIATPVTIGGMSVFLFLLMHLAFFRRGVLVVAKQLLRGLRFVFWDIPGAILRNPLVQRAIHSRVTRWVIKPGVPAFIAWLVLDGVLRWIVSGVIFVVLELFLNSRIGRIVEERMTDWAVRYGRHFTSRVVPQLIKWILAVFARLLEVIDRAIYRVDEWLRFKEGQSKFSAVVKGTLGFFWFFITYILRIYVNLLIEPTVNPIKHFPVVTVTHKIMIPLLDVIFTSIKEPAVSLLGPTMGTSFAAFTLLVIPGIAGFLVWEFKANWKLYRATRAAHLKQVVIGSHGETMLGFLKPGFHSGTIPKLYTKLRRAAWRGDEKGVARQREGLHHCEEAIHNFVERELVALLNEAEAFKATDVACGHITLGSNRVQIELVCPSVGPDSLAVRFEFQSGWMVANIPHAGWLDHMDDAQRRIFETALAGFYKQCGVDIVREQMEHALKGERPSSPPYDIADEGLLVWPGHGYETEAVYDLESKHLAPVVRGAHFDGEPPTIVGRHALFGREPVPWSKWATAWAQIARDETPMAIVLGPPLLGPRHVPATPRQRALSPSPEPEAQAS